MKITTKSVMNSIELSKNNVTIVNCGLFVILVRYLSLKLKFELHFLFSLNCKHDAFHYR
jgi:hypothetical protein